MAVYPNFKHGAYGVINAQGVPTARTGEGNQAIVYIGTAPVGQTEGGAERVNVPVLVRNFAEARKLFGYSDDWAKYTLCEAMYAHFELGGVGPLVFINVLDPATHKTVAASTASLTPANGRVIIASAEDVIIDTITVVSGSTTLTKGTHYNVEYNYDKNTVIISEASSGALGTSALTITYYKAAPEDVAASDVVGTSDGYGVNTGVYAVKNVYNKTGYIPAYLLAPGFSSLPAVHAALAANASGVNNHWNAWIFADIPIVDSLGAAVTIATAPSWKGNNGYTLDNESVFYPLAKGTDGKTYHLSVLNAVAFQSGLTENSGVPYMSGSNVPSPIIADLYFGASAGSVVASDDIISAALNANGINSAAYVGGRWVVWGMFAASYSQDNATNVNVFDTARMMLNYLTNDFQHRRNVDVDKPMPINTLRMIVAEEQARLDALIGIGALTYGKVRIDGSKEARADVYQGGFTVLFDITTTPLAKHLTAKANWTDKGFEVYFAAMEEE